jgi:RNA polymerase sigma-70 factor (ECF subfamily)
VTRLPASERDEQFRGVYAALYPKVAGYAWNLTRDREAAHDVAQETFARLFDRWDRLDDPVAYGFRIATNLARDAWRRADNDRRRADDLASQARSAPPADHALDADVRLAVARLPRRYRQLVLLHYYADLPLPEIASALGRPLGTVKRQLSEARRLMATVLEGAL